jgi:hypothetical protein
LPAEQADRDIVELRIVQLAEPCSQLGFGSLEEFTAQVWGDAASTTSDRWWRPYESNR